MSSERLLRQYYKVHAGKEWSFHMKSFFDLGFFPVNPLRVEDHPLGSSDCASLICQSAVFRVSALRSKEDIDMEKLVDIIKTTKFMKNNVDRREDVHTFGSMDEASEEPGMWKLIVESLAAIEKAEAAIIFKEDKATVVKNKKLLLALGDTSFFSYVSRKNEQIIKATHKLFLK